MFFLTLCPVPEYAYLLNPETDLYDFLHFFSVAAVLAIPIGALLFWWNNFVTHPRTQKAEVFDLRFDCSPRDPGPSAWSAVLYLLVGLLTFGLGVLAFDAVHGFG